MKEIYLDNNATTAVRKEVIDAMLPYFDKEYGNSSSVHAKGRSAYKAVEHAREVIGDSIGTEPVDIFFTSGGTESDNFAIKGVGLANIDKGKHIITSQIEHLAVLESARFMEKELGFDVSIVGVDKNGVVDLDELRDSIRSDTTLVSIMLANNETGSIQPIKEISKITKKHNIYFHVDGVQGLGKEDMDVEDLGIDLCSFSAHKLNGPKGIGVLYIRKGVKIVPFMSGGHHEKNKRAGTLNVSGIVGFGKAVEIAMKDMEKEKARLKRLASKLLNGLRKELDEIYLNGHPEKRLSNTLNISFRFIEGESLILNFDLKGIYASTGSACTSGSLDPSHVLTAMKVPPDTSQGSIRFSLGYETTEGDIDHCLAEIPPIVKRLREMSPLC
ncbi:MAG: cysteine desulfurase NifS [Candidatus Omnitrophota bacterium]